MTTKLGKTQAAVLYTLRSNGPWYRGCGWEVNNPSGTIKILESLVRRGLVVKDLLPFNSQIVQYVLAKSEKNN